MPAKLRLLLSHTCTKLGSKAWEFATPLLLLRFSPNGGLIAPAIFGLAVFGLQFVTGPAVGQWMDHTARMPVVRRGIALQAVAVVAAIGVFGLLCKYEKDILVGIPWALLAAMIGCGIVEAIGALISDVAVRKDWVATIWADGDQEELLSVNSAMARIDLLAESFGPLGAGAAIQLLGADWGFVAVAVFNVITFAIELSLLGAVYAENEVLASPKPAAEAGERPGFFTAWPIFIRHPSGIPLLVLSYSLLYFTVLSPHDVVLTAYLQIRGVPPAALAAFRAAGALAGVLGTTFFTWLSSRVGLRRVATGHLWLQSAAVSGATACFYATHGEVGLSAPMLVFLTLIVVSRFGLYGFDLANETLQQLHVDEACRGSVGAVEKSICSLGTMSAYMGAFVVSTTATTDVASSLTFDVLVYASAGFVGAAALTYTLWVLLYHEHVHKHPMLEKISHRHTTQQFRALEVDADGMGMRTHSHLHMHCSCLKTSTTHRHDARSHGYDGEHAELYVRLRPVLALLLVLLGLGLGLWTSLGVPPDTSIASCSTAARVASSIIGWTYFAAWSLSFYPQVLLNYQRKSVIGLSLDYVALNVCGYACYSAFNVSLGFIGTVRSEFAEANHGNLPIVRASDAFFSLHGLLLSTIIYVQTRVYPRGTQRVSLPVKLALAAFVVALVVAVPSVALGACKECTWLHLLNALSYVKLAMAVTKYVPQVFLNARRRSTAGWVIDNIVLDFSGGLLSLVQEVLDAGCSGDWGALAGDPVKLALGFVTIVTMVFDSIFLVQHYCLYPAAKHGDGTLLTLDADVGGTEPMDSIGEAAVANAPLLVTTR